MDSKSKKAAKKGVAEKAGKVAAAGAGVKVDRVGVHAAASAGEAAKMSAFDTLRKRQKEVALGDSFMGVILFLFCLLVCLFVVAVVVVVVVVVVIVVLTFSFISWPIMPTSHRSAPSSHSSTLHSVVRSLGHWRCAWRRKG